MKIKIQNDVDIIVLSYSGHAEKIGSKPMFSHDIWEKTNNSFSIIVTNDNDRSLLDYNIMNKEIYSYDYDKPPPDESIKYTYPVIENSFIHLLIRELYGNEGDSNN